jgi:spore cortex formation protein SpoVR/YcgB (stage V sporulation)
MEDKEINELEKAVEQIWEVARRFGLDPYQTNFTGRSAKPTIA